MDGKPDAAGERLPALEEVFQPWELAGESRRDSAPHRGRFLLAMARLNLLVGGLSFLCPPLGLLGLPPGLVIRGMARRDLDAIFAGDMDHRGYRDTEKARVDSHAGVVLSLLGSLFRGVPLAVIWFL